MTNRGTSHCGENLWMDIRWARTHECSSLGNKCDLIHVRSLYCTCCRFGHSPSGCPLFETVDLKVTHSLACYLQRYFHWGFILKLPRKRAGIPTLFWKHLKTTRLLGFFYHFLKFILIRNLWPIDKLNVRHRRCIAGSESCL